MKMMLHYLSFDWKRWRMLLMGLWLLIVLHCALVWLGLILTEHALDTREEPNRFAPVFTTVHICDAAGAFWAIVLCVYVGGADSPARGKTWIMTRARRGGAMVFAHGLFILLGVVLPLVGGYALTLVLLQFNAATILLEALHGLAFAAATAAAVMLWAAMPPRLPGLIMGIAAIAVPWLVFQRLPFEFPGIWLPGFKTSPHPALGALMLGLPALCGLSRLWRRQSKWESIRSGLATGSLAVIAVFLMPVVQTGLDRLAPGPLEREFFGNGSENWQWTSDGPGKLSLWWGGSAGDYIRGIHAKGPPMETAERMMWQGATVHAISWRARPEDQWSAWKNAEGSFNPDEEAGGWNLEISCRDTAVGTMQNGEWRVRAVIRLRRLDEFEVPMRRGESVNGNGWAFDVTKAYWRDFFGTFSFRTFVRQAFFTRRSTFLPGMDESYDKTQTPPILHFYDYAAEPLNTLGAECVLAEHDSMDRIAKSDTGEAPGNMWLRVASTTEVVHKTLRIAGLTVTVPKRIETAPVIEAIPGEQHEAPMDSGTSVWPWPAGPAAESPMQQMDEVEVARFLHQMSAYSSREGRHPEQDAQLAALVPRWLPLFLEMVVSLNDSRNAILQALIAGTPEERKNDVLRRLPDAPILVHAVTARGWQKEAKPYVVELVRKSGRIPYEMEVLCRNYRDPVFHEAMRRSFKADLATVRYWVSMPDLAPDLPKRLAPWKSTLQRNPRAGTYEELGVLLYAGDVVALDVMLNRWRERPLSKGYSKEQMARYEIEGIQRWLRTSDGEVPGETKEDITALIGASAAADYTFDSARHVFIRKPASP